MSVLKKYFDSVSSNYDRGTAIFAVAEVLEQLNYHSECVLLKSKLHDLYQQTAKEANIVRIVSNRYIFGKLWFDTLVNEYNIDVEAIQNKIEAVKNDLY